MLAKVNTGTIVGLDGVPIEVEVDVAGRGFPTFTIVGLPSKGIDEAKERVRTAIANTSLEMPDSRITVNLAPADLPKDGSHFDLPIAVGILAAAGYINKDDLNNSLFMGELSLEGKMRKVTGILSLAIMAKERGFKKLYMPEANVFEAFCISDLEIYPVSVLSDLILHLNGQKIIPKALYDKDTLWESPKYAFDYRDIQGQYQAKRVMELAALGGHNVFLSGPPGAGKTMLSRAFPSILSHLSEKESIEISRIYSVCGLLSDSALIRVRPFRAPHHTISRMGLIGGGTTPAPGEITLSHRGVLFLDEFPEFPRAVLEALRQPMEDGIVTVSRAAGSTTFPSRFQLLAAANPCPCGHAGDMKKRCRCLVGAIAKYRKRLSGPLMDRVDLFIHVPSVEREKLESDQSSESSEAVKTRIDRAQKKQKERLKNSPFYSNAHMDTTAIRQFCPLTSSAKKIIGDSMDTMNLSARAYFKIIKVARTIADLEGDEEIKDMYISEALQYRKTWE